jgi:hypothetical protein
MNSVDDYMINYIVAFNISTHRVNAYVEMFESDPLYFIKIHRDFLNTCINTHITMGTFVINDDVDDDTKKQIIDCVNQCKIPTRVVFRENVGFSYGSWNDIIMETIDDYDYFFMIEDDYVPDKKDFYIPFINRMSDNIPYVCGLVIENPYHAAHSNGMISKKACKRVLENNENLFCDLECGDKHGAVKTQISFLTNFRNLGYEFADTTDEFFTKHVSNYHDANNVIIDEYGVLDGRCLIEPIIVGAQ